MPATRDPTGPHGTVVIVSASMGGGHDGVSHELARRLRYRDLRVVELDLLRLIRRPFGSLLGSGYAWILRYVPRVYEWIYTAAARSGLVAVIGLLLGRSARARLIGELSRVDDLLCVVSTYPLSSQLCGYLRERGELSVPVSTFLTDFSVHRLWVSPGVDLHLAVHAVPAAQARDLGAHDVQVTGPVLRPDFTSRSRRSSLESRAAFGLPTDCRLALLVAGAWGVGEVADAAREIAKTGQAMPVVACGRNASLRHRLTGEPGVVALGWVDDMALLLSGVDVLVQNAGGLSALEALARRVPVITYRPIPGHGQANSAALDEAGVARWVRHTDDLPGALRAACTDMIRPAALARALIKVDAADVVVRHAAAARVRDGVDHGRAAPVARPATRHRRLAMAVAVAAVLSVGGWTATSGTRLAVAHGFDAADPDTRPGLYVIVHARGALADSALTELGRLNVAWAVDAANVRNSGGTVASAGRLHVAVLNAGSGPPYQTGLIRGRDVVVGTAHGISRLTGHAPRLFLSDGGVDAVDLGILLSLHERVVVPDVIVTAGAGRSVRLRSTEIVVIECANSADCVDRVHDLRAHTVPGSLPWHDIASRAS